MTGRPGPLSFVRDVRMRPSVENQELALLMKSLDEPRPRAFARLASLVYEIFYCTVLGVNLLIVFFDATYLMQVPFTGLTMRDVYLTYAPPELHAVDENGEADPLLLIYDEVKGIKPHRFTVRYLEKVDEAEELLASAEAAASGDAAPVLAELRDLSVEMINDDPFAIARKSGTLEVIKNRMRDHMENESGKDSFRDFWSAENLGPERAAAEIAWFEKEIRPLMEQNYFRWIGEDGEPTDFFYRYDLWFVLFFLLDFVVRWGHAVATKRYRLWYVFVVRHWYELFLLVPVQHAAWFRMLRVIPFLYRMADNRFLPDSGLAPQIIHENAGIIAEEISGMVLLNILRQSKGIVENRGLKEILTTSEEGVLDEIQEFLESQTELISKKVVPQIQPQISDLVAMSIDASMQKELNSPLALALKPILANVHVHVRMGLESSMNSPEGVKRLTEIQRTFVRVLIEELAKDENIAVMERNIAKLLDGMQDQVKSVVERRG